MARNPLGSALKPTVDCPTRSAASGANATKSGSTSRTPLATANRIPRIRRDRLRNFYDSFPNAFITHPVPTCIDLAVTNFASVHEVGTLQSETTISGVRMAVSGRKPSFGLEPAYCLSRGESGYRILEGPGLLPMQRCAFEGPMRDYREPLAGRRLVIRWPESEAKVYQCG